MATIECRSSQPGIPSKWIELADITDEEVGEARGGLDQHLAGDEQISTAVAQAFIDVSTMCPSANPSDLWQHVIYRHLLESGWSDQHYLPMPKGSACMEKPLNGESEGWPPVDSWHPLSTTT